MEKWQAVVNGVTNFRVPYNAGNFLGNGKVAGSEKCKVKRKV
jgi:hypothetical protein